MDDGFGLLLRHIFVERSLLGLAYFRHRTDESEADTSLPTRATLLSRLKDWNDQAGWRDFFESYWRLIYNVARNAGLDDAAAQDVVQNTFIYLARRMPNFHYDRKRGAFKSWLRVVTRSRIHEHWRREKAGGRDLRSDAEEMELQPDTSADALDHVWQQEWEENLLQRALAGLRPRVSSQHLLLFRLTTLAELAPAQVARKLDVSVAQVYLARHRVGRMFKGEVLRLRRETE